jgi:hypothetical protein
LEHRSRRQCHAPLVEKIIIRRRCETCPGAHDELPIAHARAIVRSAEVAPFGATVTQAEISPETQDVSNKGWGARLGTCQVDVDLGLDLDGIRCG